MAFTFATSVETCCSVNSCMKCSKAAKKRDKLSTELRFHAVNKPNAHCKGLKVT